MLYKTVYFVAWYICIVYLWRTPKIFLQEFMTSFLLISTGTEGPCFLVGFCNCMLGDTARCGVTLKQSV